MPSSFSRRAGAAVASWLALLGAGVALAATPTPIQSALPRDGAQEAQIRAIVAQMTLAQKVGQMTQPEIRAITPAEVTQYYIGSVLNGGGAWPGMNKHASEADWLALADAWWDASMATDMAVKVPIIWGTDAVHGNNNVYGMTLFPHNIGLGAAGDPALVERIGEAVARQVRIVGIDWTFAPTVAVVRDDRWGRTYEGFSEDPAMVAAFAGHYVTGLQGTFDPAGRPTIIATAKHFLGDGGTDRGVDQGETFASADDLLRIHGAGYVSALGAGVQTVMASFSSWTFTGKDDSGRALAFANAKNTGNPYLLTDVLKTRWGFDGFVVTDWDAIGQVAYVDAQGKTRSCSTSSCPVAINAGIDMVMVPFGWKDFIAHTIASVQAGEIPMARIDDAVTRILRVKMRAGLLRVVDGATVATRPSQRAGAQDAAAANPRALAREAVRRSLVLLKNDRATLPLARHGRVLVVGRAADSLADMAGGWSLTWQGTGNTNADYPNGDSVLAGVRDAVGDANVTYSVDAQGVDVKSFQAVIAVIGETPYAEGGGDIRRSSTLEHARRHPEDLAVLEQVSGHGVPVVTLLLSGRPLWVSREINRSDAFVAAWLPGTEGKGIADVLFRHADGHVDDFKGRLSYSWPRNACQTDVNKGDPRYHPQFAYGYGLTYAGRHAALGRLDESPQPARCGAVPTQASDDLVIFQQVETAPFRLDIGSPAGWEQPIGDDLNAIRMTSDGFAKAETVQVNVQQDARKITFAGDGQFTAFSSATHDFSGFQGAQAALVFDLIVDQAPAGPVHVRIDCGFPCSGSIEVTPAVLALALHTKATLRIPLQCFVDHGTDLSSVDTPFAIDTSKAFVASFANIRWQVGGAKAPDALPCTPAVKSPATPPS
ncbi:MAG: glycoside hydrolase family 3 N-terminal domain-containing protein [Burkholderiaceae bacterium]